jgi:hypothetical protein
MNAIDLASYSFNSAAAPGEVELLTALEERPLFLSDEVTADEVVLGVRYEYNTYFCDIENKLEFCDMEYILVGSRSELRELRRTIELEALGDRLGD